MFEAQVAYYLNKYLGGYVDGIDEQSLTISIYAGHVVLKNLQLKPDALAELDLPITVKAGLLGSLTLNVPWSSLGHVPVEVTIDRLYILACPRSEGTPDNAAELTIDALEKAFQKAKLDRVSRQESKWIDELHAFEMQKAQKQARRFPSNTAADSSNTNGGGGDGGGGFLRGLIDTILGNLQLSISNVHVRYEDSKTYPGHPFACGFTLENVSGSTVDEMGNTAFVTTSPLDVLRKALHLRRLAVYFNCDITQWKPGNEDGLWRELPVDEWDRWFLPGISLESSAAGKGNHLLTSHPLPAITTTATAASATTASVNSAVSQLYVLQPVDGRALYTRRGRSVQRTEDTPASEIDITLDSVALSLTQAQYHSYSMLLAEVSVYTARIPHLGYRPQVRPSASSAAARIWWSYAYYAVKQQRESRQLTWQQVVRFTKLRKEYVPAYARLLKLQGAAGASKVSSKQANVPGESPKRSGEDAGGTMQDTLSSLSQRIQDMDALLPENTVIMFRRLAYAEMQREQQHAQREKSSAAGKTTRQQQQGEGGGGWISWLMGTSSSSSSSSAAAGSTTPLSSRQQSNEEELALDSASAQKETRADLSSEEYARLIEMVSQQEEGLKLGIQTQFTLLTQIRVKVGLASAILHDADAHLLLRGSLEGIVVAADSYPSTLKVDVGVTAMGVESPEGTFIQTGADVWRSDSQEKARSMTSELQQLAEDRALSVSVVQRPQDNSADARVNVVLTPSYVYYNASIVSRVMNFFAPPSELRNLDFSGLSAAATTQLERARRAAAEYAAAAFSNKPRLKMRFDLDAPKIAIPAKDARGCVTLALDLGRFIIETDHTTAASLSSDEAGLYECIALKGSNVSAYLVDGAFDWLQETGGGDGGGGCAFVPLLERCGMDIGMQIARYAEPRYPLMRMSPKIPMLYFHVSPGKLGRLLRVINAILPTQSDVDSSSRANAADSKAVPAMTSSSNDDLATIRASPHKSLDAPTGSASTQQDAWRQHVDKEGSVKVLTWTGIGRSSAQWSPRYAILYQGKLYLYENEHSQKVIDTRNVWYDRNIVKMPQKFIGGCSNIIAVCSSSTTDLRRAAEDTSNTLLRCLSEESAGEWYRALSASQKSMREMTSGGGLAEANINEWDASSSLFMSSSASDTESERQSVGAAADKGRDGDGGAAVSSTKAGSDGKGESGASVQIDAQLGEFAVFISGREPKIWWPPSSSSAAIDKTADSGDKESDAHATPSPSPSASASMAGATSRDETQHSNKNPFDKYYTEQRDPLCRNNTRSTMYSLQGEVPLVVVRASGGAMTFSYGSFGMTIHTTLGALEIQDVLVGQKNPKQCFLATSNKVAKGVMEVGTDVFFDPGNDQLGNQGASQQQTGEDEDLAEFTLKLRRPGTKAYEGVDTSLDISLNTLFFYCNRSTVAALISLGLDVSVEVSAAYASPLNTPTAISTSKDSGDVEWDSGALATSTASSLAHPTVYDETALIQPSALGSDNETVEVLSLLHGEDESLHRSMFSLNVTLRTLQAVLNYEGSENDVLAEACMTDFSFDFSIAPDGGMKIDSVLGNIVAIDHTLPEDSPYRQACGLRPGSSTSLITIAFSYHPSHHTDARVPPGHAYYALQAKLSELRLVFLYRLLMEVLQYISTMLEMRHPPLMLPDSLQNAAATPLKDGSEGVVLQHRASSKDMTAPPSPVILVDTNTSTQSHQQQQQQPFIMVMDVEMNAPVISMPRNSHSNDSIDMDLGVLHLSSSIESSRILKPSLVEVALLSFSGVECRIVQEGRMGDSVVKNPEQGWQLTWRRPLIPGDRGNSPYFDVSLRVPYIKASITDAEYLLMTSVASDNVSELPTLPRGAQWIAEQYHALRSEEGNSGSAIANSETPAAGGGGVESLDVSDGLAFDVTASLHDDSSSGLQSPKKLLRTLSPLPFDQALVSPTMGRATASQQGQQHEAPAIPAAMAHIMKIRTMISLGEVELELRQTVEGLPQPLPLARFSIAELYVAFNNTEGGTMHVNVCVPKVEIQDLRPEVPKEQSLVISSGHKASFLMLQWDATPGLVDQKLGITLQKPVFVAELSFLLSIARFVMPSFAFVKSSPIPYVSYDVLLDGKSCAPPVIDKNTKNKEGTAYVACLTPNEREDDSVQHASSDDDGMPSRPLSYRLQKDVWLSPAVRILADAPGTAAIELDGNGHRLILPSREHLNEMLPLILVGAGRTLKLRNVTVVNAESLAACIQLGPGSKIVAQPLDGVNFVDSSALSSRTRPVPQSQPRSPPHSPSLAASSSSSRRLMETPTPLLPPALSKSPSSFHAISPSRGGALAVSTPPSAPQDQQRSIAITLGAVGVSLQLMQLERERSNGRLDGGSSSYLDQAPSQSIATGRASSSHSLPKDGGREGLFPHLPFSQQSGDSTAIHLLSITLDIEAAYTKSGDRQYGRVDIQGLRAETQNISNIEQMLLNRSESQLIEHRKFRGKKDSEVLHPCKVTLTFDLLSAPVQHNTGTAVSQGRRLEGAGAHDDHEYATSTLTRFDTTMSSPTTSMRMDYQGASLYDEAPAIERQEGEEMQIIRTDINLAVSDIRLTLSPTVISLANLLGTSVLAPLMQPGPDTAVRAASQFRKVWSFDAAAILQEAEQSAVDVHAIGIGTGITVWQPQTASGYGITGHVVTPGQSKPSFEVLTVAANSGLAAYPASYKRVWRGGGASVWRPVPPEKYVALGDVFMASEDREPELSDVLCVHEDVVIDAPFGECFALPPDMPHAPSSLLSAFASLSPLSIWCLDNSVGTFFASVPTTTTTTTTPPSVDAFLRGFDLRAPLGVTPAALIAAGAAGQTSVVSPTTTLQSAPISKLRQTSSAKDLYRTFNATQKQKQVEEVRRTLTPMVVDFRRLWSDGGAFSGGEGLTAWRPITPPGYSALGDCIRRGFDPPASAVVVLDSVAVGEGLGQKKGMPLVKAPRGYELVWNDGNPKADMRACFWKPIPHPGYVAMGCVATIGDQPPKKGIKCLRADAAAPLSPPRSPLWAVSKQDKDMPVPPLSVWLMDETTGTFAIDPTDRMQPPQECWRLKLPKWIKGAEGPSSASPGSSPEPSPRKPASVNDTGVNIVVRTGNVSIVMLDALNTPLIEIDTDSIEGGIRGPSRQVVQAYLGTRPSVSAYNKALRHWEPVVEPVDIIAKCDANTGSTSESGIEPGIHVSVKSSAEMVYSTVAMAHVRAILTAMDEWQALLSSRGSGDGGGKGTSISVPVLGSNASTVTTAVVNMLGVDAAMELDHGNRLLVEKLPEGATTIIQRPLVQIPKRKEESSLLSKDVLPYDLLLIDINTFTIATLSSIKGRWLYCTATLQGAGVDGSMPPVFGVSSGPRTRSVVYTPCGSGDTNSGGGGGMVSVSPPPAAPNQPIAPSATSAPKERVDISWSERLVVPLPSRPSQQHSLFLRVYDCSTTTNKGEDALVGMASIVLDVDSLGQKEEHRAALPLTGTASESISDGAMMLDIGYMLQRQWRQRPISRGPGEKQSWSAQESSAGQRALSLVSHPGVWSVIPTFGSQRSYASTLPSYNKASRSGHPTQLQRHARVTSVAPFIIGYNLSQEQPSPGACENVILEGGLHEGEWREILRSTCQIINSTEFTMEACVISVEDESNPAAGLPLSHRVVSEKVLGTAEPGAALPLPLGWHRSGMRLRIRPVFEAEDAIDVHDDDAATSAAVSVAKGAKRNALHEWGIVISDVQREFRLDDLREDVVALVRCAPLQQPSSSVMDKGETLFFSFTVESEAVSSTLRTDPMVDWRIIIAPPLTIINELPLPASIMVWETSTGRDLTERLTERLPTGDRVAIHSVDPQKCISFTLYPEGYDWSEPTPAVLSTGLTLVKKNPCDRFRLARPGSRFPVEVFVQKDIQMGPWLYNTAAAVDDSNIGDGSGIESGRALALGVPMTVMLFAPLWIVNATSLAIDAAIVQIPPPVQSSESKKQSGKKSSAKLLGMHSDVSSTKDTLHVLRTTDVAAYGAPSTAMTQDPTTARMVAPSSMELMSYPLPTFMSSSGSTNSGSGDISGLSADAKRNARRQHYGVRLKIAGSGWTRPLSLDNADIAAASTATTTLDTLQNAQPVLIQAEVRREGVVYEVTARLQVTDFRNSQVLRLEPHIVISNRTSVPLQLLQCQLGTAAAAAAVETEVSRTSMAAAAPSSDVVLPEGGASFTMGGASQGLQTLSTTSGRGPTLLRPSMHSIASKRYSAPPLPAAPASSQLLQEQQLWRQSVQSPIGAAHSPQKEALLRWQASSSSMLGGASMVRVSGNWQRAQERRGAVIDLSPNAAAVPLHLVSGIHRHVVCLRSPPRTVTSVLSGDDTVMVSPSSVSSVSSDDDSMPLWSRPLTIQHDQDEQYYVIIPVTTSLDPVAWPLSASTIIPGQSIGTDGVALLRVSVQNRGPGMVHIVLESVNGDPPFLLENRTSFALQYRQARVKGAPFHTLEPLSAVGYTWEYSLGGNVPMELEVRESLGVAASEVYQLESPEGGADGNSLRCRPLPLSVMPHQCTVRIGYAEAVASSLSGIRSIPGEGTGVAALGRGGIEKLFQAAPGRDQAVLAGLKGLAAPPPDFIASFELPGFELSIIDDAPQELLLFTISGLKAVASSGVTPVGPFRSLNVSVQRLQADDQLPGTRFPVMLCPARTSQGNLPLLTFSAVTQVARGRGRSFFPFIGMRCPESIQLAVSEALVWKLVGIADAFIGRASSSTTVAALQSTNSEASALPVPVDDRETTAAADVPVRIRLLTIPDVGLNISFQGDPLSRPHYFAGGIISFFIDLANFQAAPITLPGIDMANISTSRSAFISQMYQWLQGELFGIALSLVKNFGVIGGASRVLGILSAGVAKLAGEQAKATGAASRRGGDGAGGAGLSVAMAPLSGTVANPLSSSSSMAGFQQRTINDVGDGLLEGAGAFGSSLMRGIRGLVEKPIQGARKSGVEGAFKGIAQGIVGVVANPVSGALDALSATAEGFDAAFGKNREDLLVMQPRRLPRVVSGDSKIEPIVRDGSVTQSVVEQLGQALLRSTLIASPHMHVTQTATARVVPGAAGKARQEQQTRRLPPSMLEAGGEVYEEHMVLPLDQIAVLTNHRVLLMISPGFSQLEGAAEMGLLTTATVPPGKIMWAIRWDDVLAFELRWSPGSPSKYPDKVVIHRRGIPGVPDQEPLAYMLMCFSDTPQASQLKLVASRVLQKYYRDSVRQDQQWSERHAARAALPADQPPENLPLTLPCLDFKMTWHTNPQRPPVVYFWRPIAPSGYKPVGDIATLGDEAPLLPVPCFRDDTTLYGAMSSSQTTSPRREAKPQLQTQQKAFSDESSLPALSLAPTAPPEEFTLVWRYNGERAVTVWMPVAPKGYVTTGAVVLGSPSVPNVDDYLCIREDLTMATQVFDSPIWSYDPAPALAAAAGATSRDRSGAGGRGDKVTAAVSTGPAAAAGGLQTHQPDTWKVTVWPVDTRLGTFLAVRGLNKPPHDMSRSVKSLEGVEV